MGYLAGGAVLGGSFDCGLGCGAQEEELVEDRRAAVTHGLDARRC